MIEEVKEFLGLFAEDVLTRDQRLRLLAASLDKLACAYHATPLGQPAAEGNPPKRTDGDICSRTFQDLGFYPWSDPLRGISDPPMMGDAIDDLEDIRAELSEVEWRWNNISRADAQWYFRFGYRGHWGRHLHNLRSYVHAKLFEA